MNESFSLIQHVLLFFIVVSLLSGIVFVFLSGLSKRNNLHIEDEYLETKILFRLKRIHYKDIKSVSFFQGPSIYGPSLLVNIKIVDTFGRSIWFPLPSLSREEEVKLFGFFVKYSEALKNNEEFIKISKGDFDEDTFLRLAGIKYLTDNLGDFNMKSPAWKFILFVVVLPILIAVFAGIFLQQN